MLTYIESYIYFIFRVTIIMKDQIKEQNNSLLHVPVLVGETTEGTDTVRTGVSLLTDGPLLQTDQVEVMWAGSDDGLGVLHVEVADAADVPVLGQLGLGGRGQGGGEFLDPVSPGEVARNN